MTALVPVTAVTPDADFSGIQFSRSKTGHIHSPWWTYNWRAYDKISPYTIGSYFHALKSRSMVAFAGALGLREHDVICSQREGSDGELEWRIGTIMPCELPKPKLTRLEAHPTDEELRRFNEASARGAALNAPKSDIIDI